MTTRQRIKGSKHNRLKEAHATALLDHMPTAVAALDAEGRIVAANQRFNLLASGLQASGAGTLDALVDPEDRESLIEALRLAAATPDGVAREIRYRGPDGGVVIGETVLAPLPGRDGAAPGFAVVIHDVTRLRAAEAGRLALETQLDQARRLEAVGQLAGGVAHDFNNLLLAIHLNLDGLREMLPGAEADGFFAGASSAVEQARTLTRRLLAFGRRLPLYPRRLDLHAVVRDLAPALGARQGGKPIAVELVAGTEPWSAFADRTELEAALLAIADNAREAMPEGGRLVLSVANATIPAGTDEAESDEMAPGDYVVVTLRDTGPGPTAEALARAFEPFFSEKRAGHSGLGLSQVMGFARQSGGDAVVAHASEGGAEIRLYLPRWQGDTVVAATPVPVEAPAAVANRVLLVDDNPLVLRTVRRMLISLGYVVETAESGKEALTRIEADPAFALLFTDIVMPGPLSGIDLAHEVRALHPSLPILLTSGYAGDDTAVMDAATRDFPVIFKPYTRDQLAARLNELLPKPS